MILQWGCRRWLHVSAGAVAKGINSWRSALQYSLLRLKQELWYSLKILCHPCYGRIPLQKLCGSLLMQEQCVKLSHAIALGEHLGKKQQGFSQICHKISVIHFRGHVVGAVGMKKVYKDGWKLKTARSLQKQSWAIHIRGLCAWLGQGQFMRIGNEIGWGNWVWVGQSQHKHSDLMFPKSCVWIGFTCLAIWNGQDMQSVFCQLCCWPVFLSLW